LKAVVAVPEEALEKASYAELAPLFCGGATVFDAIRTTTWTPGDICLVQGIGGLGHLAVQVSEFFRIITEFRSQSLLNLVCAKDGSEG